MGKNAEKKLKKVQLEAEKEATAEVKVAEDKPVHQPKTNFNKELKQSLVCENAYISELLGIVNFPKREESDDEGKYFNFQLYNFVYKKVRET